MTGEALGPVWSARLLRARAAELEARWASLLESEAIVGSDVAYLGLDLALVATLLAETIEAIDGH